VAEEEKDAARGTARAALPTYDERQVVAVRVNGADTGRLEDDLAAVVCDDLDAVVVPKLESPDTLREVDELVAGLEGGGRIRLLGIVETAKGVVRCDEICAAAPDRAVTVALGSADLSLDLGVDLTPDAEELQYARGRLVMAAAAAGLAPPVDGPWLRLDDVDGLVADSRRSRALGFQGRVTVYPPQVEHVHRAYSDLAEEEAEAARRVVEEFERALGEGLASIRVDGRFVDYPLYERARRKLRLYETLRG
jgi:citrate lyase subunit beta/citryl-CoA lyase